MKSLKTLVMFQLRATLLLFFLVTAITVSAQQTVSKVDFDSAVDHCNCVLTSDYIKKRVSHETDETEILNGKKILSQLGECIKENPLSIEELSTILTENDYGMTFEKLSKNIDAIKSDFSSDISTDESRNVILEGIYGGESKLNDLFEAESGFKEDTKSSISSDLEALFRVSTSPPDSNSQTSQSSNASNNDSSIPQASDSLSVNWISIILILIVGVILYMIFIARIESIQNDMVKMEGKTKSYKSSSKVNSSSKELEALSKEVRELRNKMKDLEDVNRLSETQKVERKTEPAPIVGRVNSKTVDEQKTSENITFESSNILYSSIPNADGSFNSSSVSKVEDKNKSFFKFTVSSVNSQKASFEFLNTQTAVKQAIGMPEICLKPVCEEINAHNPNAKKIVTVNRGEVSLQGDKWTVTKKAEIKYE